VAVESDVMECSLHMSLRWLAPRLGVVAVVILGGSLLFGTWFAYVMIVVVGVAIPLGTKRRIDLDFVAITLMPLLPIQRRRRVPWSSLGPFEQRRVAGSALFEATPLVPPAPRRLPFSSKGSVTVGAAYGPRLLGPPLAANELGELLERYRTGARASAVDA
jgi:hypothetical protein